jgi:hypothetical protein
MTILDCVEIWLSSLRALFESVGVTVRFDRTMDDRLNPSCSLNLHRDIVEVDLIVWQSGEAELSTVEMDGSSEQMHFDDLENPAKLTAVLSRAAKILQHPIGKQGSE